jgi:hypothetical protein
MKMHDARIVEGLRARLELDHLARRNPYGLVAVAAGVGFVLGGGLSSRLADRLAGTALRLGFWAIWPRLEAGLSGLGAPAGRTAGSRQAKGESA